jgi:hypothetical protein
VSESDHRTLAVVVACRIRVCGGQRQRLLQRLVDGDALVERRVQLLEHLAHDLVHYGLALGAE